MFDVLLAQHRDVSQRSKTLYSSCEQIVKEREQLEEFADALKAKLRWMPCTMSFPALPRQ